MKRSPAPLRQFESGSIGKTSVDHGHVGMLHAKRKMPVFAADASETGRKRPQQTGIGSPL